MTRDSSPDLDKRVTWAELFFDLVFVVAVTRVATLVEERPLRIPSAAGPQVGPLAF